MRGGVVTSGRASRFAVASVALALAYVAGGCGGGGDAASGRQAGAGGVSGTAGAGAAGSSGLATGGQGGTGGAPAFVCPPGAGAPVGAESLALGDDPIGGGGGYSRIVRLVDSAAVVDSAAALRASLEGAEEGDIIYVSDDAAIDLGGRLSVPAGVTLASGRGKAGSLGALLFSSADLEGSPLITAAGSGARVTGLRIRGPEPELGDYFPLVKNGAGVYLAHADVEVDNCEIFAWGYAAVAVAAGGTTARVHHNYLHHNRGDGLGYGIVVGSQDEEKPADVLIDANLFDYNRHHIASSGFPYSSYEARANLALEHASSTAFDRHGTVDPGHWVGGDGGDWTRIHHNTVRSARGLAFGLRGTPVGGCEVHHNWFFHADEAAAIKIYDAVTGNYTVSDNAYGVIPPDGLCLPFVGLTAAPSTGPAPLTVAFDSDGSGYPGLALRDVRWDFGDGQSSVSPKVPHAYSAPGAYLAALTVTDARGVPMTAYRSITANAPAGKRIFSFYIKDGTRKDLPGRCYEQALLDDEVVWETDVSGSGGFERVELDVTANLAGKGSATIGFRAICKQANSDPDTQFKQLSVIVDDVYLSGATIDNPHFEESDGWKRTQTGGWSGGFFSGDVWSGTSAYRLILGYNRKTEAGTYAQVTQTVTLD
ncbi:MAG: PKD domain-containing protein [Sorangiineae bacterium]|nr:PKD domain-containing protein [Sorangiineae bacterium]